MPEVGLSGQNVRELTLEPDDNARLARLCGRFDENLRQIEGRLGVEIRNRGTLRSFRCVFTLRRAAWACFAAFA